LPGTNTLAYYENPCITAVKSFIVQAPAIFPCHSLTSKKAPETDRIREIVLMRGEALCPYNETVIVTKKVPDNLEDSFTRKFILV
jgi:hypothetical protein